ncbi:unnamed protein product [Caenorhabditis auriculariae]|uniref:Uncharacterized protein n=1 Tax=Caenorhabditis auriculariae TaxID=2777116 RepID=A0A8S1H373_9PELO|nr:unnamed protein product [Caenorhabditis auriculariae]
MRCEKVRRVRWADEEPEEAATTASGQTKKSKDALRSCFGKSRAERNVSPSDYEPREPKKVTVVQPVFDATLETVLEEEDAEDSGLETDG